MHRFTRHPDVERVTRRAITYNAILQAVLHNWERSLASVLAQIAEERDLSPSGAASGAAERATRLSADS